MHTMTIHSVSNQKRMKRKDNRERDQRKDDVGQMKWIEMNKYVLNVTYKTTETIYNHNDDARLKGIVDGCVLCECTAKLIMTQDMEICFYCSNAFI